MTKRLITNRNELVKFTKEQLIDHIIFGSMSRKQKEIMLTIENHAAAGNYNTRYKLIKLYGENSKGTISGFIKYGKEGGFLKQEYHFDPVGKRTSATLTLTRPSNVLQQEQTRPLT